jgi:hypothetical protein
MRQLVIIASAISVAAISAHTWTALAQEGVPRSAESLSEKPSVPAARYQMFFEDGRPTRPSTSIKIKEAGKLSTKEKSSGKVKIDQSKIQSPNLLASPKVDPSLTPSATTDQDQYEVKVRFPTLTPGSESGWARVKANDQRTKQSDNDAAGGPSPGNIEDKILGILKPLSKKPGTSIGKQEKGSSKEAKQDDDAALNAAACKAAAAAGKPLPPFCRPTVQIDRTFLDRLEAERVEQFRSGPAGGFNPNKP